MDGSALDSTLSSRFILRPSLTTVFSRATFSLSHGFHFHNIGYYAFACFQPRKREDDYNMPKTKDVVHEQPSLVAASFLLAGFQQTWTCKPREGSSLSASVLRLPPSLAELTVLLFLSLSLPPARRDVFYDVRNDTTRSSKA